MLARPRNHYIICGLAVLAALWAPQLAAGHTVPTRGTSPAHMQLGQRLHYQLRGWYHAQGVVRYWHNHGGRTLAGGRPPYAVWWHQQQLRWLKREIAETRGLVVQHGRNVIIARLDHGLAHSPMAGLGAVYEHAGRMAGVSPYLLAAAAATESSLGVAACGTYNAWGLGNCEGASWVPAFASWADAIHWYANYLRRTWPQARTPYDLTHPNYAACPACWGRKTSWWMAHLFGAPATMGYPAVVPAL